MHPTMPRRPDAAVARPAAVLMVACATVHGICAVQHWSPALSVLTIAVALACVHCVRHLWCAPRTVDWVWVTLGSAAMLGLHLIMLAGPGPSGHAHGAGALGPATALDPMTVLGLVLPLIGLALAWRALGAARVPTSGGSLGVRVPVDDHRPDRRSDR